MPNWPLPRSTKPKCRSQSTSYRWLHCSDVSHEGKQRFEKPELSGARNQTVLPSSCGTSGEWAPTLMRPRMVSSCREAWMDLGEVLARLSRITGSPCWVQL